MEDETKALISLIVGIILLVLDIIFLLIIVSLLGIISLVSVLKFVGIAALFFIIPYIIVDLIKFIAADEKKSKHRSFRLTKKEK